MKPSHIKTPRAFAESSFEYVDYSTAKREDDKYFFIDLTVFAIFAVVLIWLLLEVLA